MEIVTVLKNNKKQLKHACEYSIYECPPFNCYSRIYVWSDLTESPPTCTADL